MMNGMQGKSIMDMKRGTLFVDGKDREDMNMEYHLLLSDRDEKVFFYFKSAQ